MKATPLTNSLSLIFFVALIFGCGKEPCLDIPELDNRSAQTREWFVDDSVGNKEFPDEVVRCPFGIGFLRNKKDVKYKPGLL